MDIQSLLRESQAGNVRGPLGIQTEVGNQQFQSQLLKFTSNIGLLQRRQDVIEKVRKSLTPEKEEQIEQVFATVKELEPSLHIFFEKTDVEKDSYEQLLFSGWKSLQVLNTIPFVLLCLSFYKQFLVPILAVLTPIFMFVMPYFFLRFVYHVPIQPSQYFHILSNMLGLQNLDIKNPRTILQGSLTLFSLGQSIYQPIQNSIHLRTIHEDMIKKAQAAQKLVYCVDTLFKLFPSNTPLSYSLQDIQDQDIHQLFGTFWDSSYRLRLALNTLGDCEVIYRLAKAEFLKPVTFVSGTQPFLEISQGVDPFLETAIPFHLALSGKQHHAILTGPNRGGKSSVLRTTLLHIVIAQTFGFAPGHLRLRPFDWVATGLKLEDRPGTSSMFESEVDFSIQILQRAKENPTQIGFIVFDELFHSTNPPDGARTADIFLQKLWQTPNTASFISTHVFDLAKKAHPNIQKLCVPAHKGKNGELAFTYSLQKGVCEVSSVDLILKEKGLLPA